MLRRLLLLSLIFFISSCWSKLSPEKVFSLTLQESFWAATDLKIHDEKIFFEDEIKHPSYTWRLLFAVDHNLCLFYRTPLEEDSGTLRWVKSNERPCFEQSYDDQLIAQLEEIKSLKLTKVTKRESFLQLEKDLILSGSWKEKDFAWNLSAPLVQEQKKITSPEKLMSSSSYRGDILSVFTAQGPLRGSWEQSYADGDFHFCHRVDKDCQDKTEFHCDQCRFGWVEVVDHFCPQGGSKICGRNRCGERGEPACPRGRSFLEENVDGPCFADSTAGFCAPGLSTICDENQVLICL